MPDVLHSYYGPTEGPLGFPMTDRQAFALDAILKALPRDEAFRYRKAVIARGPTELLGGERTDVSWISTEDPDRTGDVVMARGMNDSQFRLNPIVTLNHAYWAPPVGRSLWRKFATDGPVRGIKAKTQYPARPADWPADKDWPADIAFALVGADLLRGKSIGLLPTKVHAPDTKEIGANPGWEKVGLVIDEWVLLKYACVFLKGKLKINGSRCRGIHPCRERGESGATRSAQLVPISVRHPSEEGQRLEGAFPDRLDGSVGQGAWPLLQKP